MQLLTRLLLVCSASFFSISANAYYTESHSELYESALKSFYLSDLEEATIHLKNSLKNNPEHLPSRILLAEVYNAKGDGAAAELEIQRVIADGADALKVKLVLLEAYLLQNKFGQVINMNVPSNTSNKNKALINIKKGRAYIGLHSYSQAENAYRNARVYDSKNHLASLGLAQTFMLQQKYGEALLEAKQAYSMSPADERAIQMVANIEQLLGNHDAVLYMSSQAIQINPNNFPALLTRATSLMAKEDYERALVDVDNILTNIPNEPKANYLKALIQIALEDYEGTMSTVKHLNAVLTGLPEDVMNKNPVYHYLYGLISFQNNELEQARVALNKYVDIVEEDPRAYKLLAKVAFEQGDFALAKSFLIKARLLDNEDVEIWVLLGKAYQANGEMNKAERYFKDFIESRPNDNNTYVLLAGLYQQQGRLVDAQEELNKAKKIGPLGNNGVLLLANIHSLQQQHSQALSVLSDLSGDYVNSASYHIIRGELLGKAGKHEEAKAAFEKALTIDNTNHDAAIYLARIDLVNERVEKAKQRLSNMLENDNQNIALLSELGTIERFNNNLESAQRLLEKATTLDAKNVELFIQLSGVYEQQDNLKKAIELLEGFVELNYKSADGLSHLATLYKKQGQLTKAIQTLKTAVKNSSSKGDVLYDVAALQIELGEMNSAIMSLERAISWDPYNIPAYIQLTRLYPNVEKAIDLVDKLKKAIGNNELVASLKGDVYRKAESYKKAISFYKKSNKIKENQKATVGLYLSYLKSKKVKQAESTLVSWLSKHPDDVPLSIALADVYRYQNKHEKAASHYQNVIDKFGESPIALNNLANSLVALNRFEEAQNSAIKANNMIPDNVAVMDTLAWIYTLTDQHEKALPLYRQALALDYDNPEVKYHLAVTLVKLGRVQEAIVSLTEATEKEASFKEYEAAKSLLSELTNPA